MSKIVDYVSEDNKNDMLNDVRDSDYDAFVKLSQVFELNVFCPVHMEGEKDWVVAYLMNDAVESFLVFKDSVMTGKYIDVDEDGVIRLEDLKKAIRPDTILISVMFANNEIGTVQPIEEIGRIAKENGILFHTDAVQAYGHLPIDVEALHIDMLSASGHKLHGPKGVGFLYIRKGLKIRSFLHGGSQERSRRAGTENVPGIVGLGAAVKKAFENMDANIKKETELRDYLIQRIEKEVPYCRLNGHRTKRLPGNVNFSFQFIEGESLLIMLDMKKICASSGSACTSGSLDPSHVLLAIGLPHEIAHGSLRLTLNADTTREELDYVVESVKEIVEKLRSMSPLYEDFIRKNQK